MNVQPDRGGPPAVAVIDLGTNTFHLQIARETDGGWEVVCRNRFYVKLAEEGIGHIGPAAFERGLAAMQAFRHELDAYNVHSMKAFGTAALRTADNGAVFIEKAYELTGIRIELISGAEEARLIYVGVAQAVPFDDSYSAIMDIGGGSVEFIIANRNGVVWAESFPVGVAVLYNRFHRSEPITAVEIASVEHFLWNELADLWPALSRYRVGTLVGAAGAFDVVENFLLRERLHTSHTEVDIREFPPLCARIAATTLEERRSMAAIPDERAEMIVVAFLLIRMVIEKAGINRLRICAHSLKEGMMEELFRSTHVLR